MSAKTEHPPARAKTRPGSSQHHHQGLSLERLLQQKVRCLTDILDQLHHSIQQRQDLSHTVLQELADDYLYVKSQLLPLQVFPLSQDNNLDTRRAVLERQLDSLRQAQQRERQFCWQDTVRITQESHSWVKQYSDLIQRVQLLSPSHRPRTDTPKTRDPV